ACASRLDADTAPWRSPAFAAATALLAVIAMAKPPYLPLVALLLLPLRLRRGVPLPTHLARRLVALGVVVLLAVFWTWLTVRFASAPIFRAPEEAGPLWPGSRPAVFDATDMGAQLRVLAARPWLVLTLPLQSLLRHPEPFAQMLGVLGWLNLVLPRPLMLLWVLAILAGFLAAVLPSAAPSASVPAAAARDRPGSNAQEAVLLVAACLAVLLLIYISQYLSFTPVGYDWVSGPQGRYLIPLLPVLAVAVPTFRRFRSGPAPFWLACCVLPAGLLGLYLVPRAVMTFYYAGP
ncbi:MAG: DUF2142 domain-containing protein, partial [Gluconacetobacter diazotrophicus]|nr:DUF2142 domain-containing protein [Gluconacetobacter diazotrophicus]